MANHPDPESCMLHREVQGEALTGETDGPAIEPRNHKFGMPMLLSEAEGNTEHGVLRQSCTDPARSETLCTSGSPSHRNWEISAAPGAQPPGGAGKAKSCNPAVYAAEKSDTRSTQCKSSLTGVVSVCVENTALFAEFVFKLMFYRVFIGAMNIRDKFWPGCAAARNS